MTKKNINSFAIIGGFHTSMPDAESIDHYKFETLC